MADYREKQLRNHTKDNGFSVSGFSVNDYLKEKSYILLGGRRKPSRAAEKKGKGYRRAANKRQ